MKQQTLQAIEEQKVISIIRRIYDQELLSLAKALYDGGVTLMEVTFDQADPDHLQKTGDAIRMLRKEFPDIRVGAGTVLSPAQVDAAYDAGALYIISPNTNTKVIEHTVKRGLVSIPGAMTASEILCAHESGADFVKLFPTGTMGVQYVKDMLGPISHVKFIATGGIGKSNLADFLRLGFAGAGIGGWLSDRALIKDGKFAELTTRARELADIAKNY